jgi:ATPases with chaperone activity, ATP-binding subunit
MSEFMEPHSVARLIGAPPGYVGYEEGGRLTEAVHRRPYCVILLDEIEKAHRDVFNVLLQVLDDGRLTDGHGRTVDFRNTIIVMTSNIGSEHIAALAAGGSSPAGGRLRVSGARGTADVLDSADIEIEAKVREELKKHFRPEFLNRIDEIVVFRRLTRADLRGIVERQIALLQRRLEGATAGGAGFQPAGIRLVLTEAAKEQLATDGYDPVYGARPLKRLIQQQIENPLAKRILRGDFGPGDTVVVDASGEAYSFEKQVEAKVATATGA